MKARMFIAICAVFVAVGFHSDRVHADGSSSDDWAHYGGVCNNSFRIHSSTATCLHVSIGSKVGAEFTAQNICHNYGDMMAHADLPGVEDVHFHLYDGSTKSWSEPFVKPRKISCCINKADKFCWLDQVERHHTAGDTNFGKIREVTVTSSGYTTAWVDVSTHEKRYEYCQSKPNSIYCTNNPSGDAFTDPNPSCQDTGTCNCGDHYCTAADCTSEWNDTTPATRGLLQASGVSDNHGCAPSTDSDYGSYFSATIDATDGTSQSCTLQVVCGTGDQRNSYANGTWTRTTTLKHVQFTADVDDIDDHFNCGGVLYEDSCHSGTAVSTHIEDIVHIRD